MRRVKTVEPADFYFEDFEEGQEFPVLSKGPMMVGHQVRWAGASDNYDSEFHHDEYVAKAQGLPGIILSGPLIAAYLLSAVNSWIGRNARALRFKDRNTGSTMPRDMLAFKGRITRKYREEGGCFIDIDCHVENQRGENTTPAAATALVASREDRGNPFERQNAGRREEGGRAPNPPSSKGEAKTEGAASEIASALARMVGPLGEPEAVPVEALAVMRMAMAVEDFDPIHYDKEAALRRGYRDIVAPWPFLALLQYNSSHELAPFSFGLATVHGEDAYEFLEPIVAGDTITVHAAVSDATLKEGRSGLLGLVSMERRFVNQQDRLCAVLRTIVIRR